MAVHTLHPVGSPPAPPVRERTSHLLLRAWCVFVLFQALAGVGWVHAFGNTITIVVTVVSALVSIAVWVSVRPAINARRLPWFVLGYVAWAAASILWSAWPGTTALTWLLLAITTLQGLFVAAMLTWKETVAAIAGALKWVLSLSLLFELGVSIFVRGPLLPGFILPAEKMDPIVYWSRDNLFDGGRIQGLFGNANLLAVVALLGLIVFAIRFTARAPRRVLLVGWFVLAAFLFVRAGSATAYLSAAAVVVVLVTVLLMRTVNRPGGRTKYYVLYSAVAVTGAAVLWFGRSVIFDALGRSSDLTGREGIWQSVLERAQQHPVIGWGFATPWLPWDPMFDGWIVDHGETVMQAHNMWVDVFLQLGLIGVLIIAGIYVAFIWRAWFFAIDRPRFDLRDDRPYSPLTLLPTLVATVLLVQGLAESGPLLLWGWLFIVMLGFKVTQSPLVGVGPAEQSLAIEQGEAVSDAA
ncbi:O-antigen ligase family protein [Microbacterium sp. cx-55]|uniref:O-antigen ligase family protein n=1 Tax=Microbacterium sp. cx-55 TaxID=2875948 RepID=UPI001CBCEE7F|nr:O-antigen ligase family protein [Microbacterium sp. cx-55]MBZ4487101.1 O-antigen ligase family protein [Microbacterium sp. cx-55]UGB36014.1 O-antigen ligase family protein [Microbacterium sp. cx-55]